jgi:hypothetical protein
MMLTKIGRSPLLIAGRCTKGGIVFGVLALGFGGAVPASAQSFFPVQTSSVGAGPSVSTQIVIQGRVDARCQLSLATPIQSISVSMIDDDGRVNGPAFQAAIVSALNQAGLKGWCSGANNELILSRTPFVTGTDGNPVNGFARAVLYDVSVSVSAAATTFSDATQDGPNSGATAGRFGPTGDGAEFAFAAPTGSGALTQPVAIVAATTSSQAATSTFTQLTTSRLVAGNYSSNVTLEVRPGL